ncbi:MAG: sulfatase-like hydrolase/transferase, partial [Pirellula sp.]|nr:sulfatase-like hydrolase/transferase [Pirellula sp.]
SSWGGDSLKTDGSQPNIVLILVDDLGVSDLGCYGRSDHKTPTLDSIATKGIRYTNAYCGLPICSAARAALLTGKSPSRLHLTTFLPGRADAPSQKLLNARIHSALPIEEKTIAEELKRLGYRTGLFGKWHLGGGKHGPTSQGFDIVDEVSSEGSLVDQSVEVATAAGGKNEFLIARKAVDFMVMESQSPFFCYVPHHIPHVRLKATDGAKEMHRDAFSPLYAANLRSMDEAIKLMIERIETLDTNRDTLIIFTSDNGGLHVPELHTEPVTHNAPFRAGKGFLFEGGIRIPLLVYSVKGRIQGGRTVAEPVSHLDLMPTLIECAGGKVATSVGPLDGVSLKDHWYLDKELSADRALYWDFPHYTNQGSRPASAIRKGSWKLVLHHEDDSIGLFDLANDPGEQVDLSEKNAEIASDLTSSLMRWRESVGVQRGEPNPEFDAALHKEIYVDQDPSKLAPGESAKIIGEKWKQWRASMDQVVEGRKPVLRTPDGAISLAAADVKVHGKNIRYEPEPHKNVVGYWTEVDDWAEWNLEIPEDGNYEIELQYGCGGGNGGSQVAIICGGHTIEFKVRDTGHFQNMIYETIGTWSLKKGETTLEVRPKSKSNIAVMDIRKIVLRKK